MIMLMCFSADGNANTIVNVNGNLHLDADVDVDIGAYVDVHMNVNVRLNANGNFRGSSNHLGAIMGPSWGLLWPSWATLAELKVKASTFRKYQANRNSYYWGPRGYQD